MSTKTETAPQEEVKSKQVFSTAEAEKAAKAEAKKAGLLKPRGSNITPKSVMRMGRNWTHQSWLQSFSALSAKIDRENYSKGRGNQ